MNKQVHQIPKSKHQLKVSEVGTLEHKPDDAKN